MLAHRSALRASARPAVQRQRAPVRCSAAPMTQVRTVERQVAFVDEEEPQEIDVEALFKRMEARAKAMIALEEQEAKQRHKVKFVLQHKVGLGEAWKIVGKCPELGNFKPEVAPYMKWNTGDVWTLELPVRPGQFTYKAVLKKPDGVYLWEEGPDRTIEVPYGQGLKEVKIGAPKFPAW